MDEKGHGDGRDFGDENERRKCRSCMRRKEKGSGKKTRLDVCS